MPRVASKKTGVTRAKSAKEVAISQPTAMSSTTAPFPALAFPKRWSAVRPNFSPRNLVIALLVVLAILSLWKNKNLFVVAMVNNQPISRLELENRLISTNGSQILDEIINEHIIMQAGQQKGIVVTDKDIDAQIAQINQTLGGKVSLTDALASQGLTMDEFRSQIKLQLTLEKLSGTNFAPTDQEISDYISQNSSTLTATDSAGQREEVISTLTDQKKNTVLRQLFQNLQSQAKVTKFL